MDGGPAAAAAAAERYGEMGTIIGRVGISWRYWTVFPVPSWIDWAGRYCMSMGVDGRLATLGVPAVCMGVKLVSISGILYEGLNAGSVGDRTCV